MGLLRLNCDGYTPHRFPDVPPSREGTTAERDLVRLDVQLKQF